LQSNQATKRWRKAAEKTLLNQDTAFWLDGRPTGSNGANRVCWDYFRLARDPTGIAMTPEIETPQESEAAFSIYSEFAITPETLQCYRLPSRGTYVGVLL
jgi:hypothetical protein